MNEQLIVIKTNDELVLLSEYLKDFEFVAFDTETTGLKKGSQIIGFSVCAEATVAFYVILFAWDKDQQKLIETEVSKDIKIFLSSLTHKKLLMHNATFDCSMVNDIYQIDLMPSLDTDTMILAHILDENRLVGLKPLGTQIFGLSVIEEQAKMEESIIANGGKITKSEYELYKADADLIALYGAKDTILTFNLYYHLLPQLIEQNLDKFFYEDECMPLLKGPTYQMNTSGLKVDQQKLQDLRGSLEAAIFESQGFIMNEIRDHIKEEYPGTSKATKFNIESNQQLSWLLFEKLGNTFERLTDTGKEIAKALNIKTTYTLKGKREWINAVRDNKGQQWGTGKAKIGDYWKYICCDADSLEAYAGKYKWVKSLLEQKKNQKILSTYVLGIQERVEYGIIRPSFLQHGTTSGRYSSRDPNFQNLPRDDKRIKSCIVSRPGFVFVGADYAQLEPRVFASISQDPTLLDCFRKGEDFYSVVGAKIFGINDCSMFKDDPNSFANKHKNLRQIAKAFALATPYGTGARQQAQALGKSEAECQDIINKYFEAYPKVELMMLEKHEQAKAEGVVYNLYGRPRRIPEATTIPLVYGKSTSHAKLPYAVRNLLNLAMNHPVQSTGASIMNRAAIAFYRRAKAANMDAKIVLQVHDELIIECKKEDSGAVSLILKDCMENTTILPGIDLIAQPVIGLDLGALK